MLHLNYETAPLSDFKAPTNRILFGERLSAVKQIQQSVQKHGLLNPLIVAKSGKKLIVIDGKKRLSALRRLSFSGELPRSLVNVPYILVDETAAKAPGLIPLLSNRDRFTQVTQMRGQGMSLMEIATDLFITKQCVKDLLSITHLSPRLKNAFFGGTLSIEQARAFATLPHKDAQDALLITLGPFVNAPDILKAIQRGETVLDMGDDNLVILPSRSVKPAYYYAA